MINECYKNQTNLLEKKSSFPLLFIFEIAISIFISILSFFQKAENGYEYMGLIPLLYSAFMMLFPAMRNNYKKSLVVLTVNIISFLKYSIMILSIIITKDYYNGVLTGHTPSKEYNVKAIFLILFEMLIVFITIEICCYFRRKKYSVCKNVFIEKDKIVLSSGFLNFIKILFVIITIPVIIKFYDSFFPVNFLLNQSFESVAIDSDVDGAVKILFFVFKAFLLCEGLSYCFKKYEEKNSYWYILLSLLVLGFFCFLMLSASRWNIIFPVISYFIVSKIYFKNKSRLLNVILLLVLGVILVEITLEKFSYIFSKNSTDSQFFLNVLLNQMQEYLSGIRPIAQGLETADIYSNSISFSTLSNDFTGSIPIVSHFVNQADRINIYFNLLVKGPSYDPTQIMPMITIGYAYFGVVFSGVFISLYIVLSFFLENLIYSKNSLLMKYAAIVGIFWSCMCLGFNTQIIFGNLVSSIVPLIIVSSILEKVKVHV